MKKLHQNNIVAIVVYLIKGKWDSKLDDILCAHGFNLSIKSIVSISPDVEKISKFIFFAKINIFLISKLLNWAALNNL